MKSATKTVVVFLSLAPKEGFNEERKHPLESSQIWLLVVKQGTPKKAWHSPEKPSE